jgi:hypothetical protein
MTGEELKERIRLCKEAIERDRPKETLRIALNLLDAVRTRIQTGGGNFRNSPFTPYNPQYAKNRQRAGYQSDYVDFTRTGRLWANIAPQVVESTPEKTVVVISARLPAEQTKLNGQRNRPRRGPRGNILIPSEGELDFARAANQARLDQHLKNFGLK